MIRTVGFALAIVTLSLPAAFASEPRYRIDAQMTPEERQACGLHKLTAEELARLNEAFSEALDFAISAGVEAGVQHGLEARPPETVSAGTKHSAPTQSGIDFADLEGSAIVAEDGTFLGTITRSKYDTDSILNDYGDHGGTYSDHSIFNEYGDYGGKYSSLSPFNAYTSTPPKIYRRDKFVAYLSTNKALSPRVDPGALTAWLRQR